MVSTPSLSISGGDICLIWHRNWGWTVQIRKFPRSFYRGGGSGSNGIGCRVVRRNFVSLGGCDHKFMVHGDVYVKYILI